MSTPLTTSGSELDIPKWTIVIEEPHIQPVKKNQVILTENIFQ